jgi:hypothetical protein
VKQLKQESVRRIGEALVRKGHVKQEVTGVEYQQEKPVHYDTYGPSSSCSRVSSSENYNGNGIFFREAAMLVHTNNICPFLLDVC